MNSCRGVSPQEVIRGSCSENKLQSVAGRFRLCDQTAGGGHGRFPVTDLNGRVFSLYITNKSDDRPIGVN